ncbi:MAG TPA: class I SAM-dependent methyltransferase [Candidatus Nitrosopolaris sp.]|nr:class I SAM-dependent methyltransferase [Candidatus Nitrosopolaris sp.]
MGIYAKYVLPHIIDIVMRNKDATRLRASWIPKARGRVLELGVGSGLNLSFYTPDVTRIFAVDPSRELQSMARERAAKTHLEVEFLTQSAEEPLPLEARSIDTVVTTWTLCSIPHAVAALRQARRVLKPEGRLIFVEHGRAPDPGVVAWQDRITPLWRYIGGGCHLNRGIEHIIGQAGFRIAQLETGYLPGPRPMTFTYQGYAQAADEA